MKGQKTYKWTSLIARVKDLQVRKKKIDVVIQRLQNGDIVEPGGYGQIRPNESAMQTAQRISRNLDTSIAALNDTCPNNLANFFTVKPRTATRKAKGKAGK